MNGWADDGNRFALVAPVPLEVLPVDRDNGVVRMKSAEVFRPARLRR
jgi:hypothetical protein